MAPDKGILRGFPMEPVLMKQKTGNQAIDDSTTKPAYRTSSKEEL